MRDAGRPTQMSPLRNPPHESSPEPFRTRVDWRLRFLLVLLIGASGAIAFHFMTPGWIGLLNDDAVYATSARALSATHRYLLPYLPDTPPAFQYPPGYPALLAALGATTGSLHEAIVRMQAFSVAAYLAFLGLTAWILRRFLRVPWSGTLVMVAVVALNPQLVRLSSQVMADVPLAALTTAVLVGVAIALDNPGDARRWSAVGLGLGGLVLMKLQAVSLAVAILAIAAWGRSEAESRLLESRARAALLAGLGLPVLTWLACSPRDQGLWYADLYRTMGGDMALAGRLAAIGESMRLLVTSSIPASALAIFVPPVSMDPLWRQPGPVLVLLALGLTLLMGFGMREGWRDPRHPLERVLVLGVSLHLALVTVWNASFTFLGYPQSLRLLVPYLPWCLYFMVRGGLDLEGRRWPGLSTGLRRALWGGASAVALGTSLMSLVQFSEVRTVPQERAAAYHRAFAFMSNQTAPGSRVGSALPAMTYLYTGKFEALDRPLEP